MMNLLALDTATENASVALMVEGTLYQANASAQRAHAQLLLPMVAELLKQGGITLQALDGIVFGCGPGSFTGLRVCCSIAKGLAYAHNLPLFPVSSLATMAATVEFPHVLAMLDARMQQVYWAYYHQQHPQTPEQVSNAEALLLEGEEEMVLVGLAIDPYYDALPSSLKGRIIAKYNHSPDAAVMLQLVQAGSITAVSAVQAAPVYVRNQVVHSKGG